MHHRRLKLPALAIAATTLAALLNLRAAGPARAQSAPMEDLNRFPQTTLEIVHGKQKLPFKIWIADTPQRESQGLMFVHDLPSTQGMLFPQEPPRAMTMWMKNTLIELDMVFVGSDGRISRIHAHAVPQSLATIESGGPVAAVLEIRGGEAERLGLKVGDRIAWTSVAAPQPAARRSQKGPK